MIAYVTNCNDCPFCNNDNEYGKDCNYPNNEVEEYQMTPYMEKWLPEKCPLRNGDIIITIKTYDN